MDKPKIIQGQGEKMGFADRARFYYIRLDYSSKSERDSAFGKEVELFPVIGSRELGFAQADRDMSYYIIHRFKGSYLTGKVMESFPTNQIIVKVPENMSLDSLVMLSERKVGFCEEVSRGQFSFTAKFFSLEEGSDVLYRFVEDLSLEVGNRSNQVTCRISGPKEHVGSVLAVGFDYFSDVLLQAPVAELLLIHDFLQTMLQRYPGIEYLKMAETFS